MNKLLRIFIAALLIAACLGGFALFADYRHFLDAPIDVGDKGREITIAPGMSVGEVARTLESQGILRTSLYLQAYARITGFASRIKAGEYALIPGTTPRTLMEQFVAGRVIQYSLTIVEGWTFRQMLEAVTGHGKLEHTLQGLSDEQIMELLDHPGEHPEGRFFPDTYQFPAGTSDSTFLKRAYDTMTSRLNEAWSSRSPNLPFTTPYEALILASVVEKETALPSERPAIAGVFVRRLRKGMLLQTDPTVIYGLSDKFDGNLRSKDLRADSPYNTYVRPGLPPTPISLPGAASLAAAVNPAPGDTLYFVAAGDGSHVFSTTLAEHNRAVRQHQLNR